MPRLVIALLLLLSFAPSAHAARVTVTTAAGNATPAFVSSMTESLEPGGPILIGDGCVFFGFCPVPTLRAEPGETVLISLDEPVDDLVARAGAVIASSRDATTWAMVLREDQSLPANLNISYSTTTATHRTSASYILQLVGPPPPPPPPMPEPEVLTPAATVPAVAAIARTARLHGRRLSLTVTCPVAAASACRGTITVRASGRVLARLTFAGVAPGSTRTLKTTVRRATRASRARATLSTPGFALVATSLRVRR